MTGLEFVFLVVLAWWLMYSRLSSATWTGLFALGLIVSSYFLHPAMTLIITMWSIFLIIAAFANISLLRCNLLSRPFFAYFKKVLPPMSETERVALEAGDVWWEGDLFSGRPNWEKLHAIPKPSLNSQEQRFLDEETETLCSMLDDWQIVQQDCDMPLEVWRYLKEKGFFGLVISKEYGGKGFSAIAHSVIVAKIATRSMSAAVNTMVPNSLGPGELLSLYGTEEQKNYYLPRLAKGEEVPCFALTSTAGGSDAGAMQDFGVVCKGQHNGQEVLGIRLTWDKRYITLAPIATVLGLAFKLYDPDHLLGGTEDIGITLALLPTNHPGVNVGERHFPMGLAFMNGPTSGKDVFIPLDFVIGGPQMVGHGWRMLMEALSIGRSISLPALGTAVGGHSYLTTGLYAKLRKQFKVPLSAFDGVKEALATIAGGTYLLEASRRMTAGAVDLKVRPSVVSAIQKYHATELGRKISDAAMDINAGRAIQLGPRNYVGQQYVSIPVAITVEGANILTRNLIIFGQGAMRCHPYVFNEMQAAADKDVKRGLKTFDQLFKSHIGYAVSNIVRAFTLGLTGAVFAGSYKASAAKPLRRYYRQLTRMSTALALVSDFAMLILGGQLKRRERLSARLGDVLSHLYLATTTLKYFADHGYRPEDLPTVEWCLQTQLYEIQMAFKGFFANFPATVTARVLKRLIFPFGMNYQKPSDALEEKMVAAMVQPSSLRTRMTQMVYAPHNDKDPIGRLVVADQKMTACIDIKQKLTMAIKAGDIPRINDLTAQVDQAIEAKVLTVAEGEQLIAAERAVMDAMEVDSFPFEYLAKRSHVS